MCTLVEAAGAAKQKEEVALHSFTDKVMWSGCIRGGGSHHPRKAARARQACKSTHNSAIHGVSYTALGAWGGRGGLTLPSGQDPPTLSRAIWLVRTIPQG